jgi:Glycosyl hydrolases family 39
MHATSRPRRSPGEDRGKGPKRATARRSWLVGLVLIAAAVATAVAFALTGTNQQHILPPPVKPTPPVPRNWNVAVNFGSPVRTIDPDAIGIDESTYGTPTDVTDKTAQRLFKVLGVGFTRLAVTMSDPANPQSRIICAAAGCNPNVSVGTWINVMESEGETPIVEIDPDSLSAADAAAIVKYFDGAGETPVVYWVIGNEPDVNNQESATTYSANFNTLYDAMKQVDPWIKIGGPATLGFDQPFLKTFLADSGSRVDFVDFHYYPGYQSETQLIGDLSAMSADLSTLRTMIDTEVPNRASSIGIHVGEWNISTDPQTQAAFAYSGFASMFDADMLGRMLTAGADSLVWGSKNGPMSVVYGDGTGAPAGYTPDTPMPIYEALGMFTGESLFPHFGVTIVSATSYLPTVDAFASASPDEIVLVNKGTNAMLVKVHINSALLREATVWQLNQTGVTPSPPRKVGTAVSVKGTFDVVLPGFSVTTLIMTPVAGR